jgi:hypothetical protein
MDRPRGRTTGVVKERIGDELVVYDQVGDVAHCLSADAAGVWEHCDGRRSPEQISEELGLELAVVERALRELRACSLLDEVHDGGGFSRREATLRIVKVGGAALTAPLIYSVAVPSAAAAASGSLCVGVTCVPLDQCHVAGTCDPTTGLCSNPFAGNGTPCTTGNLCFRVQICVTGACEAGDPVTCTPLDECHVPGTCNPSTGMCSNPPAANGTSCNGGNGTCQAGVCTPN